MKKRKVIHKNKIKKGKFATTCGNPGKKVGNSRNLSSKILISQNYDPFPPRQRPVFHPNQLPAGRTPRTLTFAKSKTTERHPRATFAARES
jgi:hypothetical protein